MVTSNSKCICRVLVICGLLLSGAAKAQTTTFTISRAPVQVLRTLEDTLGLPAKYSVVSCSFVFTNKGEVFKKFVTAPYCSEGFELFYSWAIARAKKGDVLIIDDITVLRDGQTRRLKEHIIHL